MVYPPAIASTGFDDDKLSQPLMITSCGQGLPMKDTLLDGRLMVELINKKLVGKINPRPPIFRASRVKTGLANNATTLNKSFQDSY